MKTRKALLLLAALAGASTGVYGEKITFQQAPPAVQQAIRSKAGRTQIEDIDKDVRNGQVTYEASFKVGGTQQELLVSETGTILRDIVGASTGLSGQNLTLSNKTGVGLTEAPQAVQVAISNRLLNVPVDSVQRGIWNGQNIYEVTYHDNGQLKTYQVTETGQPVIAGAITTAFQPRYAALAEQNVSLSNGSKMAFKEAPQYVQRTVTHLAAGAQIEDFERGQWNGRTVYEAAFKRNGEHVEVQILEDGSIVTKAPAAARVASTSPSTSQPSVSANRVGAIQPYGPQLRQPTRWQPNYAGLSTNNVQIANGVKLTLTETPRPVQMTINRLTGGIRLDDLERGQWNGRTVYEAAYKQNGQHTEIQILEDGSVLTSAPSASGAPAPGAIGQSGQK